MNMDSLYQHLANIAKIAQLQSNAEDTVKILELARSELEEYGKASAGDQQLGIMYRWQTLIPRDTESE